MLIRICRLEPSIPWFILQSCYPYKKMQAFFSCRIPGIKSNASACVNVPVYIPAATVVATENLQVESTRRFKLTRLYVCSIKEASVLHSVSGVGLRLVFQRWDVAHLMLKVSQSFSCSWSISSPLLCAAAQECPGLGETWHAAQQRDDEGLQWAFKGINSTRAVTWIAPVERHW